jgi:AcrR family transcriptional regulator
MPPKKKFELDTVIDSAFQVLRREGYTAITARSIAQELGSSTTPIYWVLDSMDKVEEALRMKTISLMAEYQSRSYTDNVFINLAIGYVEFARCEPNLFRFMYLERLKPLNPTEEGCFNETLTQLLGSKPPFEAYFGKVDQKFMDKLTLQSWIFTHGLAVAVSTNMLAFNSEKEIEDLLVSAGSAFYLKQISNNK